MNRKSFVMRSTLFALFSICPAVEAGSTATVFTYQGQLKQNGAPLNDTVDLEFRLFDAATGGSLVGSSITRSGVVVTNGLFTVDLDFGLEPFNGQALFLEVAVQTVPADGFTTLAPRRQLTSTPHALWSAGPWQTGGTSLFYLGGNVGVGTSTPGKALEIFAGDTANQLGLRRNGVFSIGIGPESTPDLYLVGGDVGIGTQSPAVRLHVAGSIRADGGEYQSWGPIVLHPDMDNTGDDIVRFVNSSGVVENMRISENGNVGIGTTAPANRLSVVGTVESLAGGFRFPDGTTQTTAAGPSYWSVAGLTHIRNTNSGTVAIGGTAIDPNYKLLVFGDVAIVGDFGVTGTKDFRIDHPLDPANMELIHYCAEGPEPLNHYSGNVVTDDNGYATIKLPSYFESINKDFRYQLTVIDDGEQTDFVLAKVVQKIRGNQFVIRTSRPDVEVSWQVQATRNDPWVQKHGYQAEVEKPSERRGQYLNPQLYNAPPEKVFQNVQAAISGNSP